MAGCDAVCEHIHLPLQSGSTRILKAMRRTYSQERYLALVDKLCAAIPDLALTTDLIVGFRRDRRGTRRDRRRGRGGVATTGRSPSSSAHAAAPSRNDARPGARGGEGERIERLIEVVQVGRPPERRACRPNRAGAVEGLSRTDPALRGPHAAEHDGQPGMPSPGALVDNRIEGLDVDDAPRHAGSPSSQPLTRSPDIRRATRAPFPIRLEAEGGPRWPRCHVHR